MWCIKNLIIEKRINSNADCMTVFNYPDRNLVELLTHKNSNLYKNFPKHQVVGVWKIKNKTLSTIEAAENLQSAFKDVGISIKKEVIPIISKLHDCFFKFKKKQ